MEIFTFTKTMVNEEDIVFFLSCSVWHKCVSHLAEKRGKK